jgi:aquaglyceroporin related protein, other eukaryote
MSTTIDIPTPEGSYIGDLIASRPLWKDAALEFLGTFVFVYISLAGVNQVLLTNTDTVNQLHIAICFTLGLSSGIIVAGPSGGHLNPAVTLTIYASTTEFGTMRCIMYMLAQVCGGFGAGLVVLAVYWSAINEFSNSQFLGAFGTLRNPGNSLFASVLDQFIGSALLMFGIARTPPSWSKPVTIGAILGGLGLFQGTNGFAFNLARDFGPRVASAIVFGSDVFTSMDHWFWVPMIIPFFGVAFGWICARYVEKLL